MSLTFAPFIQEKKGKRSENGFLSIIGESGPEILFLLERNSSASIQPIRAQAPPTEGKRGSDRLWSDFGPDPVSSRVHFRGKSEQL